MRISDWSSDVCSSDLSELEAILKEASALLHPMHVLLQQMYKAILNNVRPSRAGSQLCAQAADRAAISLTSAIMPSRSLEAAALLTDRKSVRWGKGGAERVLRGGSRDHKKKKNT